MTVEWEHLNDVQTQQPWNRPGTDCRRNFRLCDIATAHVVHHITILK